MGETWKIVSIEWVPRLGKFKGKAEGRDSSGRLIGGLEVESKSLSRFVEILEPAKPTNI